VTLLPVVRADESPYLTNGPAERGIRGTIRSGGAWILFRQRSSGGSNADGERDMTRSRPAPDVEPSAVDGPRALVVVAGGMRAPVPLDRPFVVGRGRAADLLLNHPSVSRRHLVIEAAPGGWTVRDISSNGTWLDGRRIRRVDVGSTAVRLRLGAVSGSEIILSPDAPAPVTAPDPAIPLPATVASAAASAATSAAAAAPAGGMGGDSGQKYQGSVPIRLGRMAIGRARDNDIVVNDLQVSRSHAELLVGRGGIEVVDLGSVNGTFVNGARISRSVIGQRDVIAAGHHIFQLVGEELLHFVDAGDITFEADGLNVRVDGGARLLRDISFRLPGGSLLAVIGPSGSGKSTLLNALTGFRPADTGTVRYSGRDMYADYDELRRRIGYVPQDDILHTLLTVREALDYGARLRFPADTTDPERRARIDEVLVELGLTSAAERDEENRYAAGAASAAAAGDGDTGGADGGRAAGDLADRQVRTLSGGQRKRTSVALELLTRPTLLFLDEPTSGLDPGLDKEVMETLRRLADGGRTVIVVTHSVAQLNLCDYVLALARGGQMAYFGEPQNALKFFGEGDWADVFRMLTTTSGSKASVERFRSSPYFVPASVIAPAARPNPADLPGVRQQRMLSQALTLGRRYLRVIAADRVYLRLTVALPVLLGLVTQVVPAKNGFTVVRLPNVEAGQVLLIIVLAASFMGLANAISEVVKERAIYRRERTIGLSRVAYLGSKIGVLTLMTAAQGTVFTLIATFHRLPPRAALLSSPRLEILAGVVLLTWASSMVGLLLSTVVDSGDKVMPLLVLATVAQLVFCGGFFPLAGKNGLNQFSYIFPTRWCFAAVASTADLNVVQKLGDPLLSPDRPPDPRWRHAGSVYAVDIGVGFTVTILIILATLVLLGRVDSGGPRRRLIGARARSAPARGAGTFLTPVPPVPENLSSPGGASDATGPITVVPGPVHVLPAAPGPPAILEGPTGPALLLTLHPPAPRRAPDG